MSAGAAAGARFRASDLAVVIPTRDRWPILERCLDALAAQDPSGAEVIIVADGKEQQPVLTPRHRDVVVTTVEHGGPGPARNVGIGLTQRPLVLLVGDDVLPSPGLVAAHLAVHDRRPAVEDAVLGLIRWHPEVERGRIQRWMEWSATQFDYGNLGADPAGWARFYTSNVSFKKELFERVGGFDTDFRFHEDLDLGWRMEQAGMRLWFEPAALGLHVHRYDWGSLRRRYEAVAHGERTMAAKHPWFQPWFRPRCQEALSTRPPRGVWPLVVDRLPAGRWSQHARNEANRWYFRQLAPFFLNAWESDRDFEELRRYLGDRFEEERLHHHTHQVAAELAAAPDEATFYRTSEAYLYDLTAFASWTTKIPYRMDVRRFVPPGARLLDYGCGIGSDGLRLIEEGYRVDFADFDNPGTRYLKWRLEERGIDAAVFDVDREVPGGYDLAYSFDVIEHVEDPSAFLDELESRGRLVAVNFIEHDPDGPEVEEDIHRPLPIRKLLDRAERRGLLRYRRYHGRSHFVIYGDPSGRRSRVERRLGPLLSRRLPGRPPSSPGGACWSAG